MGPDFRKEMTAPEFRETFSAHVTELYGAAWLLSAESSKGYGPVGAVLGVVPSPLSPFVIVGDMLWFPWSSARNRLEATVGFFNGIRKEVAMIEFASEEHKAFFEHVCSYGIMRRVGTSRVVYEGNAAVFETVKPEKD